MRKQITLSIVFIFTVFSCFSQETPLPEGYKLRVSPNIIYAYRNVNNNPDLTVRNRWNHAYWFKVDNTSSGKFEEPSTKEKYIKITIPSTSRYDDNTQKWLTGTNAKAYNLTVNWVNEDSIDGSDFNTWLWIRESDFNEFKVEYTRSKVKSDFVISGLTVPFKYRPSIGDQSNSVINGDLNIGSFIGVRLSQLLFNWDFGVSIGGHLGLSSISLNASNNPKVTGDNTETIQGFTYGTGIIFDVKKEFQIGIVLGQDYGIGNLAKTYSYQKRNWFSFSLNYNFLNRQKGKEDTNKKEAEKVRK